jgi:hypothetical protein
LTITRGQISSQLINSDGGVVTWGTDPTAGQKILIAIWSTSAETITSVIDNGTSPTTYTQDFTQSSGGHAVWIYRADGITLPGSGSYGATVSTGNQGHNVLAGGIAYSGVLTGGPTATNSSTGTSTTPATGAVTPAAAGALFFGLFSDASANNDSITINGAPFTEQFTATDGTIYSPGAAADRIDSGGPSSTSASWTIGASTAWVGGIATYDAASSNVTSTGGVQLFEMALAGTGLETIGSSGGVSLAEMALAEAGTETGSDVTSTGGVQLFEMALSGFGSPVPLVPGGNNRTPGRTMLKKRLLYADL